MSPRPTMGMLMHPWIEIFKIQFQLPVLLLVIPVLFRKEIISILKVIWDPFKSLLKVGKCYQIFTDTPAVFFKVVTYI